MFFYLLKSVSLQITLMIVLYTSTKNINNVINSLNHDFAFLSNWFYEKFMVLNPDKCSFMLFGFKDEVQTDLVSNNVAMRNSKEEKVLGITFDKKFYFSTHLSSITKKANTKLEQKTILSSPFIKL